MLWAAAAIVAFVLALAVFAIARRARVPVAVASDEHPRSTQHGVLDAYELDALDGGVVPPLENAPLAEVAAMPLAAAAAQGLHDSEAAREIHWPQRFDPRAATLGDDARLQLLHDLGLLRAGWCVPILRQACEEESSPQHLSAARAALAACAAVNGAPSR